MWSTNLTLTSAMAIDAFSLKWDNKLFYLFLLFSVIASCLQKDTSRQTKSPVSGLVLENSSMISSLLGSLVRPPILVEENKLSLPIRTSFVHLQTQ